MGNYTVEVNGNVVALDSDSDNNLALTLLHKDTYQLIRDNQNYQIKVVSKNPLIIQLNGREYHITIKDEIDQLVDELGYQSADSSLLSKIYSPMPGLVLSIYVEEGQKVKQGDSLLILEAMKMENVISSPIDGTIKSIHVEEKAATDKGALLIEFE